MYKDEVIKAMNLLANNSKVYFIGQSINTMATGLSLTGYIPVSVYMRMDFLILAMNQLVNHLDKMEALSCGQFKPKVIVRAIVGNKIPLDSGPQHTQDHTELIKQGLTNIDIVKLINSKEIVPAYMDALYSPKSTILVEVRELYDKE